MALWGCEAAHRAAVGKMRREYELLAAQTQKVEARFSRVARSKESLMSQTLVEVGVSLKAAKQLSVTTLTHLL